MDCCPDDLLYLFVGLDRTSKFAYVELHAKAGKMAAADFLRNLISAVPDNINIVLTKRAIEDAIGSSPIASGIQFTNQKRLTSAFTHIFDGFCQEHQIDHRLTKVRHPWSNGQVERVNRTIKEGEAQSRSGGSATAERKTLPRRRPQSAQKSSR